MRMMDELKPLFLYSANKKVYAPIDEKDRRHNAAILLLSPNLETSSKMMNLPYIHNPNLFTSFYIDRNVMAYIGNGKMDDIELDEKEEEAISEAMLRNWNRKTKFKYDDNVSIMDKRYCEAVFNNATTISLSKLLKLTYMPEVIKVFIYPNISSLRDKAPNNIANTYKDKLYSYSNKNEIHIVSKLVYDPETMGGSYEIYLKNELICNLLLQANPDLSIIPVCAIAQVASGLYENKKVNGYSDIATDEVNNFAKAIQLIFHRGRMDVIYKYIRSADINVFIKFTTGNIIHSVKKLIFESEISYFERQNLLPSEFGIPDKRKYPIHDEDHVRSAVRMFNNCDPSEEKELAENIIKKINKFGITDIKVSAANRFKTYYDAEKEKAKAEKPEEKNQPTVLDKIQDKVDSKIDSVKSKAKDKLNSLKDKAAARLDSILKREKALLEGSFDNSDYADILRICNHLSPNEFRRISFYDTYRDSKFVIKRIIKREGGVPAGFLDVYQFPSKPDLAQIVIAVANDYRGRGIADAMVKELMDSDLQDTYDFNMYYWTAHPDNIASQNLALKNGFQDNHHMDEYGRKVFVKLVKDFDNVDMNDISDDLKPSSDIEAVVTENAFVTSDMALISEANDSDSQKLRQYLYQERLKNNKETIILYDKIKQMNPDIKRAYIKLEMYKKQNLFVDLSYYHGLFLKNNTYRMDKAVNFYFDFLNKLIDNKEVNKEYSKRTIFIPIDDGVWPVAANSDVFDYKKNLNPISIIMRLVRTNLAGLKKAWGNKTIIFVGTRGYFKVDFKNFDIKNLARFRSNIEKIMSTNAEIVDEYEIDDINDDIAEGRNGNSSKALTAKIVDTVEKGTSIKLDNISDGENPTENMVSHLVLNTDNIELGQNVKNIAIISVDPEGVEGYDKLSKTILANAGKASTYCIPE